MITAVLSQVTYPGVGDIDECGMIATVWAARASDPTILLPTVRSFRAAAGDPDDGDRDGWSFDEIRAGTTATWPALAARTRWLKRVQWLTFVDAVKGARGIASVAVTSAKLRYTYGFLDSHQVGVYWDGTSWRVANPLAPNGSRPTVISEAQLRAAVLDYGNGFVYAAVFPAPATLGEEVDVDPVKFRLLARTPGLFTAAEAGHAFRIDRGPAIDFEKGHTRNVVAKVALAETLSTNVKAGLECWLVTYEDELVWALIPVIHGGDDGFTAATRPLDQDERAQAVLSGRQLEWDRQKAQAAPVVESAVAATDPANADQPIVRLNASVRLAPRP